MGGLDDTRVSLLRFRFNILARIWSWYIVELALGKLEIIMIHIKVPRDGRTDI